MPLGWRLLLYHDAADFQGAGVRAEIELNGGAAPGRASSRNWMPKCSAAPATTLKATVAEAG